MIYLRAAWAIVGGFGGLLRVGLGAAAMLVYAHWWLVPQAIKEARSGYVLEVRATAAEAKATEMQRQIDAQRITIDAYQVQYRNQLARYAKEDQENEKAIADYEAQLKAATAPQEPDTPPSPPKCDRSLRQSDIEFLRK